jgi:cell division protein FtsQ
MIPESSNPGIRKTETAASKPSSGYGLWLLFVLTLFTGIYWGWTLLNDVNTLPIRIVKIEANYQHISRQALETLIAPYVEAGFFNMNAAKLKQQIAHIPWVAQVSVHRVWPDKVIVRVIEHQAVARWNEKDLLTEQGKLFNPPLTTFPEKLPWFMGPDKQIKEVAQTYKQISEVLSSLHLNVSQITLDERGSWKLGLENGLVLLLGKDDIMKRLALFMKVYPSLFAPRAVAGTEVDLRYPNGLAVRWNSISSMIEDER